MSNPPHSEERYPLLFLFLDDGNKASRKDRGVFFERGRSQGIISGATNVFTQWPGHLSSCTLTMIILLLSFLFLFLMILASIMKPLADPLHPRCLKRSNGGTPPRLYLVHSDEPWHENQLLVVEEIATKYPKCNVELISLRCGENSTQFQIWDTVINGSFDMNINIGTKRLLRRLISRRLRPTTISPKKTTPLPTVRTVKDLVKKFPKITLTNVTCSTFFNQTPLFAAWKNFNAQLVIFAARVVRLWEHGGISFVLPEHVQNASNNSLQEKPSNFSENKVIKSMIDVGYGAFRSLPYGVVTVDEKGVHMSTKTTCHAFFGEALAKLKHANKETTVEEVIADSLKTFCVRGAVDSDYCNSIKAKRVYH